MWQTIKIIQIHYLIILYIIIQKVLFADLLEIWKTIGLITSESTATFVENHDNPRFLYRSNREGKFTNEVVFFLLWEGIPVFYYGGEQCLNGGEDPNKREPLQDSNYKTSN